MDPISTGIFASIGSAFKFADVALRIAEVGSENSIFVRTIHVVRSDLEEVERLLSAVSVQRKLGATPGKLPWIKTAIYNTKLALNEIGKWVERARVEQESTGSIKLETRVRWVFSDHEKLLTRKIELSTCHQQLSNILVYLAGLELAQSNSALQDYEDTAYFDDVLARHRRRGRPKMQKVHLAQKLNVQDCVEDRPDATSPISSRSLPPVSGHQNRPDVLAVDEIEHGGHLSFLSIAPEALLPGSPPPTYTTAVSVNKWSYNVRPPPDTPVNPPSVDATAIVCPVNDCKDTLLSPQTETWAYRSVTEDVTIPDSAGDIVVLSATNSAGPVNPYELCMNPRELTYENNRSPQRPNDSLSEMLGAISFPAELSSSGPEPPPRITSHQVGYSRSSHAQSRNGTVPEIPTGVHRQSLPFIAVSDSLPTVVQLSPSFMPHTKSFPELNAVRSRSSATDSPSDDLLDLHNSQRQSSSTAQQAQGAARSSKPAPGRHYSEPLPAPVSCTDHAAAFAAESTSTWSLNTNTLSKAPMRPRAQDRVISKRMQNQKRMMDLLGSIGT